MIRAIIWMALVAGLMGLANAASTVYEQFQLGTSGWLDTAAPITLVLGGIVDTLDNCRTICNNVANCPGAVYYPTKQCYLIEYGGSKRNQVSQVSGSTIIWKYDVPGSPSCSSQYDKFSMDGACECNPGADVQDGVSGCKPVPNEAYAYSRFMLSTMELTYFAGTVDPIQQEPEGYLEAACRYACDLAADCIGYLYQVDGGACTTMKQGTLNDSAGEGFAMVAWKFDGALRPTCSSETNDRDITGQCYCPALTQQQDTPFGCTARIAPLPSQALRRKDLKNRIAPGVVKKAVFA